MLRFLCQRAMVEGAEAVAIEAIDHDDALIQAGQRFSDDVDLALEHNLQAFMACGLIKPGDTFSQQEQVLLNLSAHHRAFIVQEMKS